jgi:ABC-type uncharacterized transport system permease subunit
MLLTGSAIIYSFWTILATLSFWFVRVENILEIFRSMYEAGRWPISLYPPWLRFTLSFIVPVAFVTTVPVEALTGRLSPKHLLAASWRGPARVSRLVWARPAPVLRRICLMPLAPEFRMRFLPRRPGLARTIVQLPQDG